MFDMIFTSIGLFLRGRLFANRNHVIRQALIGIAITAVILIAAVKLTTLPLWACAAIAGLIGGASQPLLFKNLKYA